MSKVISRIFRVSKPEVLDLGPLCGATAVYLADRGARVSVEDFQPPAPTPKRKPGRPEEPPPPKPPFSIDQPSDKFHLVLAWEAFDFTPPDRLVDLSAEIERVLVPGGWLLLFSLNDSRAAGHSRPSRYRLVADDRIAREEAPGAARRRWVYATRDLERSLGRLRIQGIHLQRDQTRELLALKPVPKRDE